MTYRIMHIKCCILTLYSKGAGGGGGGRSGYISCGFQGGGGEEVIVFKFCKEGGIQKLDNGLASLTPPPNT